MRYRYALFCVLLMNGCIRTRNYHPENVKSTFHFDYGSAVNYGPGYFHNTNAYEAYVEFDARGSMYRDRNNVPFQLNAALKLINDLRHPAGASQPQKINLYVFIHGWKNNASEASGNVWGFRRFLSEIAYQHCGEPVVGLYIGWPGASLKNDQFLSFWNREPVADNVGNGELTDAMRQILKAVKGPQYDDPDRSTAVVIGHSFGGIVLERVATRLLEEQFQSTDLNAKTPADLFVLLNEAGAAAIARPFLLELADKGVTYNNSKGPHPLLLSMTSTGDIATKFAYPGGEFLSINRPVTETYTPPDRFGQTTSLPYNLLTAANLIALQSHQIVPNSPATACSLPIPLTTNQIYCMNPVGTPPPNYPQPNRTPYWIMQLPQVFVPDHSDVFQDYLLSLISAVFNDSQLTCRPPAHFAAAFARPSANVAPPPPPANDRPNMRRSR